jgi:hydroxyacylglutathione hydrolase
MLEILQLPVLADNYIYLLHEPVSDKTAAVDPAIAEPVIAALSTQGWQLDYIFNTHHHNDHVGANLRLKQLTNCKIIAAEADQHRIPGIDIAVNHNDEIQLGKQTIEVIATPGHTSGHIVFYCAKSQALFCGDTLFSLGCGRLFEGSAEQMWQSLQRIKQLPTDTKIYCAHEYTLSNSKFALSVEPNNTDLNRRTTEVEKLRATNTSTLPSTLSQELATNPFLRTSSVSIRNALNISENDEIRVFTELRKLKDTFQA